MFGKRHKKPNISYLCPEHNEPSGGIKVLYRHAEYLSQQGFDCSIYHPNDPTFRCDWFSHNVNFRSESYVFQPNSDHVVIPEIWAAAYHQRFREKGVPYSMEEGFSLPPLEAAFAANIVVGYTGRGAKEYFDEVIFRSVDHDDFNTFVKKLTRAMQDVEDGFLQSQVCKNQQDHLANNYSQEKAEKLLTNFAEAIKNK